MNENPACGRAAGGKCETDSRIAGYSRRAGSETRCPVMGLKPSGKSSGPYVRGVGQGCGVGETSGVVVGTDSVALAVASEATVPGGVAVEVLAVQDVNSKTIRSK